MNMCNRKGHIKCLPLLSLNLMTNLHNFFAYLKEKEKTNKSRLTEQANSLLDIKFKS